MASPDRSEPTTPSPREKDAVEHDAQSEPSSGRRHGPGFLSSDIEPLIAECLAQVDQDGEQAIARICAQHPEHAQALRRHLHALREVGLLSPVPEDASFPEELGDFRLIRRLGGGGMGVVFLAQQRSLNRQVALKLIRSDYLFFADARGRFRREVEAVSRLKHPGVVPIYTVGEESGIPYFAMEHIEGCTLSAVLEQLRGRAPGTLRGADFRAAVVQHVEAADRADQEAETFAGTWEQVCLRVVRQVANALDHAHAHGVLHRDVKPSNIIVTADGRALLLDFGLAQAAGTATLTQTGSQLGSLPYMAPERIASGEGHFDPRADVYSLGVTLYELLTLRSPYFSASSEVTRQRILTGHPEAIRSVNAPVSWEAETVCLAAMERDPARRYASAASFARDLDNVLAHRPIEATRPPPVLRVRRWMSRHPVATVALLLGSLLSAASVWFGLAQMAASRSIRLALARSEGMRLIAQSRNLLRSNPGQALLLAIEGAERQPSLLARNALWEALTSCCERRTLIGHTAAVNSAVFDSRGERVITASNDMTARIWDVAAGAATMVLLGHTAPISAAGFSHDGARAVTASDDGTARIWDVATGTTIALLEGHRDRLITATFSPDDRQVLTTAYDGTARVWDTQTWHGFALTPHRPEYVCASFSADGAHVVTASYDRTARIADAATGAEQVVLASHDATFWGGIRSAEFSPDGRLVVTASCDNQARIWDVTSGHLLTTLMGHQREVLSAKFDPGGDHIVTGSYDGTARTWSVKAGVQLRVLRGHLGQIFSVSYRADGRRIITAGDDGTARVWDAASGSLIATLAGHGGSVNNAMFSPDGLLAVTASSDHTARLWDVSTNWSSTELRSHADQVTSLAFSADGKELVTTSEDQTARIFATDTGEELVTLRGHDGGVVHASFSPDGSRVVTCGRDRTARIWETRTGTLLHTLRGHALWLKSACFSPDGSRLLTMSGDTIRVWDPRTAAAVAPPIDSEPDHEFFAASFSADGSQAATVSQVVRLWDARTWQVSQVLQGHDRASQVLVAAFTSDGSRILTASGDRTVRIWSTRTAAELMCLRGHTLEVQSAAFDAEEHRIVTASLDGTIFDTQSGNELVRLDHPGEVVASASFSRDGRTVLTRPPHGLPVGRRDRRTAAHRRPGSSDDVRQVEPRRTRAWPGNPVLLDPLQVAKQRRPRDLTPGERARFGLPPMPGEPPK
ncbi:MAG: protein kinase [Planctomycetota bacterium]